MPSSRGSETAVADALQRPKRLLEPHPDFDHARAVAGDAVEEIDLPAGDAGGFDALLTKLVRLKAPDAA